MRFSYKLAEPSGDRKPAGTIGWSCSSWRVRDELNRIYHKSIGTIVTSLYHAFAAQSRHITQTVSLGKTYSADRSRNTNVFVDILQHNYSAPSYGHAPGLSTSVRSEPSSHIYSQRPTPVGTMRPSTRGPYAQYQPGHTKSAIPMSVHSAKSTPIGVIQEERASPQASPHHPSNQPKPKTRSAITGDSRISHNFLSVYCVC